MGESDTYSKNREREQQILRAATTLIAQYGYDKTSVSDIATEAGISKGAVYLHFASKEDLLYQLILEEMLAFINSWAERIKNDNSSKVFASMYRHSLFTMKENDFRWALFSKQRWLLGNSFIKRQGNAIFQQRLGLSQTMLTQLKAVGAIRQDIHPDTTAYVFNMLNYGYLRIGDVLPEALAPPTDELVNEIGELVQRHLEPDGEGNPDEARKIILSFLTNAIDLVKQMLEDQ